MTDSEYVQGQAKRFKEFNPADPLLLRRLRFAWRFFSEYIDKTKPVLDLGARDGWFVEYLSKRKKLKRVMGIELVPEAVVRAQENGRNVIQGDAHDLSQFSNESFGTILMIHSLEHCHSPSKVAKEIRRLLQNDGIVYIEVPVEKVPDKDVAHFVSFSCLEDLTKIFSGFEVVRHRVVKFVRGVRHIQCVFKKR